MVLDRQAMDVDEYAKRIADMKPEAVVDVCSHELNKTQVSTSHEYGARKGCFCSPQLARAPA